jgi:hypothetical protein
MFSDVDSLAKYFFVEKAIYQTKGEQASYADMSYRRENQNFRRLHYLRYFDDFVLGFTGPKKDAFYILQLIIHFLFSLGIKINIEKTNIVHHSKGIIFLGYHVCGDYITNYVTNNSNSRTKISYVNLKFIIPTKQLLERYKLKGFFRVAKKGKSQERLVARRVNKWLMLELDADVINRFNWVMLGLNYYYCGSTYKSGLYSIYRLLRISCALTLAHRHKYRRAIKAFKC